ncbi:MAG: hypothetical protein ACOCZK_03665 [Planctomycetota bacterium]
MDPKKFLLAHGEKFLIALVVIIAGWMVYATISDESTQFGHADEVSDDFGAITRAENMVKPPVFRDPAPIPEYIERRFGVELDVADLPGWIVSHPDLTGEGPPAEPRPVVYEILVPELAIEPKIGGFELTVELPEAKRANPSPESESQQARIKDAPIAEWERNVGFPAENVARWHSVQIEYAIGEAQRGDGGVMLEWLPLDRPDLPGGKLELELEQPRSGATREILLTGLRPWEMYHFRARLLVEATAVAPGGEAVVQPQQVREVLVLQSPLSVDPKTDQDFQALLEFQSKGTLPEAAPQRASDDLFVGRVGERVGARVPSKIALCLERVRRGMADIPDKAVVLVKRKIQDPAGTQMAWTEAVEYVLDVGDPVGRANESVSDPFRDGNLKTRVNLNTPFVVRSIESDVERTYYYEVRRKTLLDEDGAPVMEDDRPVRQFQVEPYRRRSSAVVLRNTKSDKTVTYIEVARIRAPYQRPGAFFYPEIPADGIDEKEVFEEQTDAFQNPTLAPAQPILHRDPGKIRTLVNRAFELPPAFGDIEQPIVEMPDGRIILYETLNKLTMVGYLPGTRQGRGTQPDAGDEDEDEAAEDADEEAQRAGAGR